MEDAISKDDIIFKLIAAKVMTTVDKGCVNILIAEIPKQKHSLLMHCRHTIPATDNCWWKQEPEHTKSSNNIGSAMKQPSKENKQLICFACCESGHIKPYCPSKQQISMADKQPIQKKDGLKVQFSIPDSDNQLIKTEGLRNGMKMTIILDPAADISLVPKEYVSKGKWDGRRANVVAVQGPTFKRDTAIGYFEVQGCT